MAGKGPSGAVLPDLAMPTVLPTSHEKCPKSPGKRKYYNLADAETAAAYSARQYGKPMRAYVCDGCGLYHVTGKVTYGDVTSTREDGTIVTAGMATRPAWKSILAPVPVERADMSEVIAMESPITPGNVAARERMLTEWLNGKTTVTVPDVQEFLAVSRNTAGSALRALGWTGMRGRKEWFPPGTEPAPVPVVSRAKPESVARMNRRKNGSGRDALHKSRARKLKAFLEDRTEVSTIETMEALECGNDTAKALLKEAGWNPGWGANAKWTPGEDKLAHRRRIVPTPSELELVKETPVEEPIDLAARRHPAGSALHSPIPSEDGWRPVPSLEALLMKQVSTIIEELGVYGLEMRIEIREKRQ